MLGGLGLNLEISLLLASWARYESNLLRILAVTNLIVANPLPMAGNDYPFKSPTLTGVLTRLAFGGSSIVSPQGAGQIFGSRATVSLLRGLAIGVKSKTFFIEIGEAAIGMTSLRGGASFGTR